MTASLNRTRSTPNRVVLVAANPAVSTTLGWPGGYWASELTHPYHQFTEAGADSQIGRHLVVAEATGLIAVDLDAFVDLFCHDAAPADAQRALARLRPDALAPLATPLSTTPERFGRVPRVYVETTRDLVVSPAAQKRMRAALPVERVVSIGAGHAPFLAKPDELAKILFDLR